MFECGIVNYLLNDLKVISFDWVLVWLDYRCNIFEIFMVDCDVE